MRIFRLIATPVILLGLLGALIWGALWGWKALTAPIPEVPPVPCITQTVDPISGQYVSVRIFNAGFTTGAAGRLSDSMKARNFDVLFVSNVDERVEKVTIRGNPKQEGQLRLVQDQFDPETFVFEPDDRVDGTFDIILPTDGIAVRATPVAQIAGGVVCVVPPKETTPKPTPTPTKEP